MEIYNETVTDLLVDSWKRKPLEVREGMNVGLDLIFFNFPNSALHSFNYLFICFSIRKSIKYSKFRFWSMYYNAIITRAFIFLQKNVYVADLTEELVTSPAQALAWIRKGESEISLLLINFF